MRARLGGVVIRTRTRTETSGARGLGRLSEPDPHLLEPEFRAWSRALVHADDRTVSVSWVRGTELGLHSVTVEYGRNVVRVGTRMGTRPALYGRSGYVALRMIVEHTVVRLREPLRGRSIEVQMAEAPVLTRIR